ncbi:MAG: hypothetical protein AB8G05_24940 [Oligoflexales bacterium]
MKIFLPIVFCLTIACGQFSRSNDHSSDLDSPEQSQASATVSETDDNQVIKPSTEAKQKDSEDKSLSESAESNIEDENQEPGPTLEQNILEPEIVEAPPCVADETLASPKTIEEAVTLINSLPMPVSIVCLLQALKKPFRLVATRSSLSAQPANGEETPRFFLFYDQLIISVVPGGDGKDLVEFSYLLSNRESIKGELEFPVSSQLDLKEPYTTSLNRKGDGSRCAVCHVNERPASEDFPENAFISKAIKPMNTQISRQFTLDKILLDCQSAKTERCDMINALLEAPYEVTDFPESMPSFF